MRTFSKIVVTLCAIFLGTMATEAQTLELFKQRLSEPKIDTLSGRVATVKANEDISAANVLRECRTISANWKFTGWRVCIFSDNSPEARSEARAAINNFEQHFAGIPIYDEYASPYFRVSVGNCTTTEEAIILLERVRHQFPKAFVKQEELTISDLLK